MQHTNQASYRPDIDGLRAIAVLLVMVFHAFPNALPGGYIGVDIFFVISGYLITGIIAGKLAAGRFSFLDFYTRRVKRIFPSLITVLTASLLIGWFLLLSDEYKTMSKHAISSLGFVTNWLLYNESGYFDTSSDLKPFLHLWSLSIEEQFYIFWPLILFFVWRRKNLVFPTTIAIVLLSFSYSLYETENNISLAFYSPLSRAWEFLAGGVLALLQKSNQLSLSSRRSIFISNALSLTGLALIFATSFLYTKNTSFPGAYALAPTFGAFFIIAAGPQNITNKFLLSSRLLVWIGLISYPLYLWHWPLISFLHILKIATVTNLSIVLLISFLFSYLTYLLVENRIRFSRKSFVTPSLVAAAFALCGISSIIFIQNGVTSRVSSDVDTTMSKLGTRLEQFRTGVCHLGGRQHFKNFGKECFENDKSKSNAWLYGDSHAGQFYQSFKQQLNTLDITLTQTTLSGCAPWGGYHKKTPHCIENNKWIIEQILEQKPDTLFIGSATLDASIYKKSLDWLYNTFNNSGIKNIIILGKMSQWSYPLPEYLIKVATADKSVFSRLSLEMPHKLNGGNNFGKIFQLDDKVEAYINKKRYPFRYYSMAKVLCDKDTGCFTRHPKTGGVIAFDYWHLTIDGSDLVADALFSDKSFRKGLIKM